MNGCYDTLITPRRSADISCGGDGLDITYYTQEACQGHVLNTNHSNIHNGCGNKIITNPMW